MGMNSDHHGQCQIWVSDGMKKPMTGRVTDLEKKSAKK